jgi:hypothetical protein
MGTVNTKSNPIAWTVNSLYNNLAPNNNTVVNGGYTTSAITNSSVDASLIINQGRMTVTVPLDVNGIDVEQVLKDLMAVTGVVNRNRDLESKFKGLKQSGEQYQLLLQKLQSDVNIKIKEAAQEYRLAEEKYKIFETIKDSK